MRKPSLRRPPSDRRAARRSLVELTALASRAVRDGLPVTAPGLIAAADRPPQHARAAEPQAIAAARIAEPDAANAAASDRGKLQASDSTAELAVQIAKEFQARALEDFKLSMNTALDYAKDLVDTRTPKGDCAGSWDNQIATSLIATSLGAAAQYRAEAFALLKANLETTLDYAHEIARARTPAEFVELSSEHARKQCEFVLKQTGALKSLARAATKSDRA